MIWFYAGVVLLFEVFIHLLLLRMVVLQSQKFASGIDDKDKLQVPTMTTCLAALCLISIQYGLVSTFLELVLDSRSPVLATRLISIAIMTLVWAVILFRTFQNDFRLKGKLALFATTTFMACSKATIMSSIWAVQQFA